MTKKQSAAGTKRKINLFGLTLTKEELGAVRSAMQADYESLSELSSHDPEWGQNLSIAGSVLYKIRLLDGAVGYKVVAEEDNA